MVSLKIHGLEHTLSVLYNIPHGAGLSIVYPAWLKFHRSKINQKLAFLAKEVFSIHKKDENEAANLFILELEKFFIKINTPIRLEEAEIQKSDFNKIIDNFKLNKVSGSVYLLDEKSYDQILGLMWSSSIK